MMVACLSPADNNYEEVIIFIIIFIYLYTDNCGDDQLLLRLEGIFMKIENDKDH